MRLPSRPSGADSGQIYPGNSLPGERTVPKPLLEESFDLRGSDFSVVQGWLTSREKLQPGGAATERRDARAGRDTCAWKLGDWRTGNRAAGAGRPHGALFLTAVSLAAVADVQDTDQMWRLIDEPDAVVAGTEPQLAVLVDEHLHVALAGPREFFQSLLDLVADAVR